MRGVHLFLGWFGAAMFVGNVWWRDWLWAAIGFAVGFFYLTRAYKVASIRGVRLPWVEPKT